MAQSRIFADTLNRAKFSADWWNANITRKEAQEVFDAQEDFLVKKLFEMEMVVTFLLQRSGAPQSEFAEWAKKHVENLKKLSAEQKPEEPKKSSLIIL